MPKIGDAKAKLILCFMVLLAVGLIAEAQPLTNLSKCSELSKNNCLSNPNCELKKARKRKSVCVDRPQSQVYQTSITFRIDIIPSNTNLTTNEAVSVFWNNSGTAWANDFIAFAPKGAQWGSKFTYFYIRASLSGNSTLNAPSTPGYYELVYYGSNGLREAARSTTIEVKASYEASAVVSATATCKDNSSFVTILWQMSNWPFAEGPKGTEVIIEDGQIFSNQLDSGSVTWDGAQHNTMYNYRIEWLKSRLPDIVGLARNGTFTTLDCSSTQCTDSDNGENYETKGFMKAGQNHAGQWDSCLDASNLVEYYCKDNSGAKSIFYCNGCIDGACSRAVCGNGICEYQENLGGCAQDCITGNCRDTDTGRNYFYRGMSHTIGSGPYSQLIDECLGEFNLQEAICNDDGTIGSIIYSCACRDGACLTPACGNNICEIDESQINCRQDCCPRISQPSRQGCTYTPRYNENGCITSYEEACPSASVTCSSLSSAECSNYPNCELKRSRKNRQRCADKT